MTTKLLLRVQLSCCINNSLTHTNLCYSVFSFRTYKSNGLLLYNARSNRVHHDYIALEIIDRQLVFSFSLGELYTKVHASLPSGVSDGEWHEVQINYANQVNEYE